MKAAVLIASVAAAQDSFEAQSGHHLADSLAKMTEQLVPLKKLFPDNLEAIRSCVREWVGEKYEVVFVTGGTGRGPRDQSPEAITPLLDLELPVVTQMLRAFRGDGLDETIYDRAVAGMIDSTVIIVMPDLHETSEELLLTILPEIKASRQAKSDGNRGVVGELTSPHLTTL